MKAYNIGQLKNNPSSAIKDAKGGPVLVMNRENPEAIIISLDNISANIGDSTILKQLIAVKLYQDDIVSLGRAAKIADLSYNDFLSLLTKYGIPILKQSYSEIEEDFETAEKWLKKKAS